MKKFFDEAWWILGALVAAPTTISLIQNIAAIRLAIQMENIVDYYRALILPIYHYVRELAPILPRVPFLVQWLDRANAPNTLGPDLYALSFLGGTFQVRALAASSEKEFYQRLRIPGTAQVIMTIAILACGLTGFGLLLLALSLAWVINGENSIDYTVEQHRAVSKIFWATVVAVALFFSINHISLIV